MSSGFYLEDLHFEKKETKNEPIIRAWFQKRYYFDIPEEKLKEIGPFELGRIDDKDQEPLGPFNVIFFEANEKRMINKMNLLIDQGFKKLTNSINQKPTLFINEESKIPLVGSIEFGIIDRGTNILEVKPLTGCNLNCVYCSVDEGINNKIKDYLIDHEYLTKELEKIAAIKEHPIEINIGPHGEPLLYPKFIELVRSIKKIPNIEIISVNTNGILLNEKLIDELEEAGLTRINLSLNTTNQEIATKMAGKPYPTEHILKMIEYINKKKKITVLLAPLIVPTFNDDPKLIKELIILSTKIRSPFPTIGFQNFLNYDKGRNPVKQMSWESFNQLLEEANKTVGAKIRFDNNDFRIIKDKELPRPIRKGEVINATILTQARYPREYLARFSTNDKKDPIGARVITITNTHRQLREGERVKIKIYREKHNIYKATLLK